MESEKKERNTHNFGGKDHPLGEGWFNAKII